MKSILKNILRVIMLAFFVGLLIAQSGEINQMYEHIVKVYHHEILFVFIGCIFLSRIKSYCESAHRCNCECDD